MTDDAIPEYLRKMAKEGPIKLQDSFGPEDLVWTGEDGQLDPEELIAEHGFEPETSLEVILMALVKGHSPDIEHDALLQRLKTAKAGIIGSVLSGRGEVDDHRILKEVAWEYFKRFHELRRSAGNRKKVKLAPVVRSVIETQFPELHKLRNIDPENLYKLIERKFKKDKDIILVRATLDDDWDRFSQPKMRKAIEAIAQLQIPIDGSASIIRRLSKNINVAKKD